MKKSRIVLEKQLIVGWNSKIHTIIDEYAHSMRDASSIDIVVHHPDDEMASEIDSVREVYKKIKIRLVAGDIHDPGFLVNLKPQDYDNVVILAEESESTEEVDLKTVSRLLEFRHFFRDLERKTGSPVKTKLVTEIIDVDKPDIFFQAGAKDFLIPHKFVSEIIAQISREPYLKKVYDTIFADEGSEIYVKPVSLYFRDVPVKASFADCMLAAQTRGEVCFGVKIGSEATDIERNYGLYLPPDKNAVFDFNESDALVTLAETRN